MMWNCNNEIVCWIPPRARAILLSSLLTYDEQQQSQHGVGVGAITTCLIYSVPPLPYSDNFVIELIVYDLKNFLNVLK